MKFGKGDFGSFAANFSAEAK